VTPQNLHNEWERDFICSGFEEDPSATHPSKATRQAIDWALLRLRERGYTYEQIGLCIGRNKTTVHTRIVAALARAMRAREMRWVEMARTELPLYYQRLIPGGSAPTREVPALGDATSDTER